MKKVCLFSRILATILALCFAASLVSCSFLTNLGKKKPSWSSDPTVSAFVDEIGGCSETYTGAVSEKKYDKAEDAAKEYIANEIVAADAAYEIEKVESEGKLSKKELKALDIPETFMKDAEEVEKYTVTYLTDEKDKTDETTGKAQAEKEGDILQLAVGEKQTDGKDSTKVTVYVIKFADYFKYFSPRMINGDTLTKSYYDSIFNEEKYKNCTMNMEMEMNVQASGQGESFSATVKFSTVTKLENGKIYMEQKAQSDNELFASMNKDIKIYLEEKSDGSILCYVNQAGTWQETNMRAIGFTDFESLTPFHDQYLDHSYFTKTDYGCKLGKENFSAYMNQAMKNLLNNSLLSGMNMDLDGYVDYYVSEGVLSGTRTSIDMDMSVEGVTAKYTLSSVTKCTDYGKTVVEAPTVQ